MASARKSAPATKAPRAPRKKASTKQARQPTGTSERKARFAVEWLKDQNATQAAIRAGYASKAAYQQGSRLLKDPQVLAIIKPAQEAHVEAITHLTLTAERIKQEIARLALFDPRKLFDSDGQPKPITELDDDTAAALAGLDVLEEFEGTGEDRKFVGYTKKYKIADKNSALEKAARILGLFEKDNAQRTDPLKELLGRFKPASLGVVADPDQGSSEGA